MDEKRCLSRFLTTRQHTTDHFHRRSRGRGTGGQ